MFKIFTFKGGGLVNWNGYRSSLGVRSLAIMNGKGFKLHVLVIVTGVVVIGGKDKRYFPFLCNNKNSFTVDPLLNYRLWM